jgi:hypothetical protein
MIIAGGTLARRHRRSHRNSFRMDVDDSAVAEIALIENMQHQT